MGARPDLDNWWQFPYYNCGYLSRWSLSSLKNSEIFCDYAKGVTYIFWERQLGGWHWALLFGPNSIHWETLIIWTPDTKGDNGPNDDSLLNKTTRVIFNLLLDTWPLYWNISMCQYIILNGHLKKKEILIHNAKVYKEI